jgi:hypothetical protein
VDDVTQKTSLLYWYPLIKDILPTPRTEIVPVSDEDIGGLFKALDGKGFPEILQTRLFTAAGHFNYPLFLRTDFTSGKHDFLHTCFVQSDQEILSHVVALFEDTLCKDISIGAYVFREFVMLDWGFKAFRGLPISRERRYFVEDGKVLCHHPYWPEDAIEFHHIHGTTGDWKKILNFDLNIETPDEIHHLTKMAETFSTAVPGAWSVDFAKTKFGSPADWILIDAAEAFRSWHPSNCPVAFPEVSHG